MKRLLAMMILTLLSCKTTQKAQQSASETLLSYSKGACLGNCPVYDVAIDQNGILSYNGLRNVPVLGKQTKKLSPQELTSLLALLKEMDSPKPFKKIRDKPVTVLKYNQKKYSYHATNTSGNLKKINTVIENLVAQLAIN